MTLVTAQMSVSMDGFYAGPKHDTDPQRWMDGPKAAGFFRVTRWVIDAEASRQRLLDANLNLGDKQGIELAPIRVINTPDVTHIRYRLNGHATLLPDYRSMTAELASIQAPLA